MKPSQRLRIQRWLAMGRTITPLQALRLFSTMALSQRCGELRKEGWPVVSRMVKLSSGKRVSQYRFDLSRMRGKVRV